MFIHGLGVFGLIVATIACFGLSAYMVISQVGGDAWGWFLFVGFMTAYYTAVLAGKNPSK